MPMTDEAPERKQPRAESWLARAPELSTSRWRWRIAFEMHAFPSGDETFGLVIIGDAARLHWAAQDRM